MISTGASEEREPDTDNHLPYVTQRSPDENLQKIYAENLTRKIQRNITLQ